MQCLSLDNGDFAPASADASFRRYFRLRHGDDSWIVMDAPPEREDTGPFVRIAGLLADAGLHVPAVIAQSPVDGFLLLSDLGTQTYLQVLDANNADALFSDAIEALVRLQSASRPGVLPEYDAALLHRELALFPDWFVQRHLGREFNAAQQERWDDCCERLVESALAQPRVWVHRDFMPRNLMPSQPNPGVIDFQDAVYGPVSYDLVCLFKDAFVSWPATRVAGWIGLYRERAIAAGIELPADFDRALDWMGVQRHLKVLGIFARICHRDGKPQYLEDAPRFIRYVREVAGVHAPLAGLLALFDELGLSA